MRHHLVLVQSYICNGLHLVATFLLSIASYCSHSPLMRKFFSWSNPQIGFFCICKTKRIWLCVCGKGLGAVNMHQVVRLGLCLSFRSLTNMTSCVLTCTFDITLFSRTNIDRLKMCWFRCGIGSAHTGIHTRSLIFRCLVLWSVYSYVIQSLNTVGKSRYSSGGEIALKGFYLCWESEHSSPSTVSSPAIGAFL